MVSEEARCEVTGAYWLEITGGGGSCFSSEGRGWLMLLFSTTTVTEGHWPVLFFSNLQIFLSLSKCYIFYTFISNSIMSYENEVWPEYDLLVETDDEAADPDEDQKGEEDCDEDGVADTWHRDITRGTQLVRSGSVVPVVPPSLITTNVFTAHSSHNNRGQGLSHWTSLVFWASREFARAFD